PICQAAGRWQLANRFGQIRHHRELTAAAEHRTRLAVDGDLLGHPRVRHDRETESDEVAGVVRERTERLEPGTPRSSVQLRDERTANAARARAAMDDERTHFGDAGAQRRE